MVCHLLSRLFSKSFSSFCVFLLIYLFCQNVDVIHQYKNHVVNLLLMKLLYSLLNARNKATSIILLSKITDGLNFNLFKKQNSFYLSSFGKPYIKLEFSLIIRILDNNSVTRNSSFTFLIRPTHKSVSDGQTGLNRQTEKMMEK